jgi:hypothetical protein
LTMVRADLGHPQRLACVSITGPIGLIPMAASEVLQGLLPLHLVMEVETRVSAHTPGGTDMWLGRDWTLDMPRSTSD